MSETNALAEGAASTSAQTETEQKATETETQTEAVSSTEKETETEKESEGKKGKSASEYIKELKRERNEQALARYAAEQEVKRLKRPLVAKEGMTEFQRAALEVRQADRQEDLKEAEERHQEAVIGEKKARQNAFEEAVQDRAIIEGFYKVRDITDAMADAIVESDCVAELAAYFGNNPKEASRISKMEPHLQGLALGRIEAKLSAKPSVRNVSNAPEPSGTRLKGGSSPAAKAITDPTLSMEEYAERRKSEMRKAAQR